MLAGKKILLGVTGSIAAYKAAHLIRLFRKEGAEVRVVMTPSSCGFIGPITLSTLSEHPVVVEFEAKENGHSWNNHVELGLWADAFVIAPASANTIGAMAQGICNNLLLAVYLSARCPVHFAPAMDLDMFAHASVENNIKTLEERGDTQIEPGDGELASGLVGKGRMAEPEDIIEHLVKHFSLAGQLAGKEILISAGPTHEAIDPVRYIGNHSSGKMGFALALEAAKRGAHVNLIAGPTALEITHPLITRVNVVSSDDMFEACTSRAKDSDVIIMAAAVADYAPVSIAVEKLKKQDAELNLELKKTKDTLMELGRVKTSGQFLVGFALETENEVENAQGKLERKNLDLVVLNSLNDEGAGFAGDTNRITIIDKHNKKSTFELKSKSEVASDILDCIHEKLV